MYQPKAEPDYMFLPGVMNLGMNFDNLKHQWVALNTRLKDKGKTEIEATFLSAPLRLKGSVDLLFGQLALGVFYSVSTPYCIASLTDADYWKASGMNDVRIPFDNGSMGLFLGLRF